MLILLNILWCIMLDCVSLPNAVTAEMNSNILSKNGYQNRIAGGSDAKLGEFPYQALLVLDKGLCGCSLIKPSWVITAAHCTYEHHPSSMLIVFGIIDLTSKNPTIVGVYSIYNHPHYNISTLQNDVSLLQLKGEVPLGHNINLIFLPFSGESELDGRNCTITGWGALSERNQQKSDILQKATVPIVKDDLCVNWYQDDGITIKSNQICAGYENGGIDGCQGDSGGPLACSTSSGKQMLEGITSFGVGCARPERPGVYTKVSAYINWIKDTLEFAPEYVKNSSSVSTGNTVIKLQFLCLLITQLFQLFSLRTDCA